MVVAARLIQQQPHRVRRLPLLRPGVRRPVHVQHVPIGPRQGEGRVPAVARYR